MCALLLPLPIPRSLLLVVHFFATTMVSVCIMPPEPQPEYPKARAHQQHAVSLLVMVGQVGAGCGGQWQV